MKLASKRFKSTFIEIALGEDGVSKMFKKETKMSNLWSEISLGRVLPPNGRVHANRQMLIYKHLTAKNACRERACEDEITPNAYIQAFPAKTCFKTFQKHFQASIRAYWQHQTRFKTLRKHLRRRQHRQ